MFKKLFFVLIFLMGGVTISQDPLSVREYMRFANQNGFDLPPIPIPDMPNKFEEEEAPKNKIYIIIDDIGGNSKNFLYYASYPLPLTFAVLPKLDNTSSSAIYLKEIQRQHDVILHLPLEPLDAKSNNPGPGAIYTTTSSDEMHRLIDENLLSLGIEVKGVNNHMGSRVTQNYDQMKDIVTYLNSKNLFFLDSRTSNTTSLKKVSSDTNIHVEDRDVFLDNEDNYEYIEGQLKETMRLARKNGYAIATGHVQSNNLILVLTDYKEVLENDFEMSLIKDLYY